jgi:prolipoprotein diacylglyceryltransferase
MNACLPADVQMSPLLLLDALCLFALVGDMVGRVGCHFYGCCFGLPLQSTQSLQRSSLHTPEPPGVDEAPQAATTSWNGQPRKPLPQVGRGSSSSSSDVDEQTHLPISQTRISTKQPDAAPFHPLAVLYLHPDSSVVRMRPDLRLRPLLPTQLLQALWAAMCQAVLLAWLVAYPTAKVRRVEQRSKHCRCSRC